MFTSSKPGEIVMKSSPMLRVTVLTDGAAPEAISSSKQEISGSRDLA